MHTEDEATRRWCPFSRGVTAHSLDEKGAPHINQPQGAINRIYINGEPRPYIPEQSYCIASGCMAWRWVRQTQDPDGSWNVMPMYEDDCSSSEKLGFCGLAGRV